MLSTTDMPSFVLIIIFAVAATATLLQDISLVPASRFAGHNNTQVPTAARDVLNRLLNRQATCDPGYGLCPNGGCCPTTDNCCSNADLCVEVGGKCCSDNQHTCSPDWNCCGSYCSPVGEQCCTTGYYCPNGWWCVLYSGQQYCCDGLGCLGRYNPMYQAVPTITAVNLQAPTNGAGSGSSSTYVTPPDSTTESPSAATATAYVYYTFTVTWSYDSYYYTGTADWEYTWSTKYDSTTVSFYCSDYEDASYSAEMYSNTEDFPTPTNAALPSTNSLATATGIGSSATGGAGSGSSSGELSAGTPGPYSVVCGCVCWVLRVVESFALSCFGSTIPLSTQLSMWHEIKIHQLNKFLLHARRFALHDLQTIGLAPTPQHESETIVAQNLVFTNHEGIRRRNGSCPY